MNNEEKRSESVQLQHPELWRLVLGIDEDKLNYIVYTPAQENSLMTGEVTFNKDSIGYLKSVENAVYDNPLLLNDFGHVTVAVRSGRFILLPPDVAADEELMKQAFSAAMPDVEGDLAHCHLPGNNINIAFELPKGLLSFLQRTFNMPVITHHLHALCEHALELNRSSETARMYLHVESQVMDAVVFKGDKLVFANSFNYTQEQDATYFALHVWKTCGLDSNTHQVIVTGDDKPQREAMMTALRQYIAYVMPGILPAAALRMGDNAHQAPTHLILLSLCE